MAAPNLDDEVVSKIPLKTSMKYMYKIFQDPLHDCIELHPLLVKIIDTPQYQRLRDIKQLGCTYFVFPAAAHNRFEHSLGVCYLATYFINRIHDCQPELKIQDREILCIQIAALCHDLGHGPFSHLFEDLFIEKYDKTWKHQNGSIKMLEHLVEENKLEHHFKKYGLDWERDKLFINELITGETEEKQRLFLYQIVANTRSGVDVDKMDYIARDCHGLGIGLSFDWNHYMHSCRVIDTGGGELQICTREKEINSLYNLFAMRNRLFRQAYQHKTKRAIEHMIADALHAANDHFCIPGKDGKLLCLSDTINDMVAFTNMTDSILHSIRISPDPKLKQSQVLLKEVQKRKLYKYINSTLFSTETQPLMETTSLMETQGIPQRIAEKACECEPGLQKKDVAEKIVWDIVTFDYGKGDKNPMNGMWFYRKQSPNKAFKIKPEQASHMLPHTFQEHQGRLYSKSREPKYLNAMRKGFIKYCKEERNEVPLCEEYDVEPQDDELPKSPSSTSSSDENNKQII